DYLEEVICGQLLFVGLSINNMKTFLKILSVARLGTACLKFPASSGQKNVAVTHLTMKHFDPIISRFSKDQASH
ncbi:MAG: hypothetical protein ABL860_02005, partial [Candidatus Nitrotoga sp.]